MAKKNVSPIMTWVFWSTLVLVAFLMITWDFFIDSFTQDSSRITWLIMGFFIYGFGSSFFVALFLQNEFKALASMSDAQHIGDAHLSDIAAMFDAAMERIRRNERIEVRTLVAAYGAKVKAKVDNIHVISGMLTTIGLLGTVVGLIKAVNGLELVLQDNTANIANLKLGFSESFSGMGTAFYTTFIGALLGGVVLKVLGSEMRKSGLKLVAETLSFGELFISPQFGKNATESLVELEIRVSGLHEQLGKLSNAFGQTIETIDSKQVLLSEGLGGLVEAVERTSQQASERTEALVTAVSGAIGDTSRQADERLSAITTALEQTNAGAEERLKAITAVLEQSSTEASERANALVAAISESVESTNQLADERLGTISTTVGAAVEESGRRASEQLETVVGSLSENVGQLVEAGKATLEDTSRQTEERTTALAENIAAMVDNANAQADERTRVLSETVAKNAGEANKLADERLQSVLSTMRSASHAVHEEADKQMAGLVENVEKAVDKTRKDAEERLNAKAADLAGKLSEAATMLSGLVAAPADESEKPEEE